MAMVGGITLLYINQSSIEQDLAMSHFVAFIVVYSLLILVILLGNGLVLVVYVKHKHVRVIRFNGYIALLASVDVLVGLVSLPFFVHGQIFPKSDFSGWNLFREWAFRFPVVQSVFVFIMISYDRVRLVTNPMKYHTSKGYRDSTNNVVLAWMVSGCYASLYDIILLVSFLLFLPPIQELDRFEGELLTLLTKCGQAVIYFLVPLSILLATNWNFLARWNRNLKALIPKENERPGRFVTDLESPVIYENERLHAPQNSTSSVSTSSDNSESTDTVASNTDGGLRNTANLHVRFIEPVEGNPTTQVTNRRKKLYKTARNLLLLETAFLISWLPINVLACLRIFLTLPDWLVHIGFSLLFLNAAINPLIFTFIAPTFRHAMYSNICLLRATLIKVRRNNTSSSRDQVE